MSKDPEEIADKAFTEFEQRLHDLPIGDYQEALEYLIANAQSALRASRECENRKK